MNSADRQNAFLGNHTHLRNSELKGGHSAGTIIHSEYINGVHSIGKEQSNNEVLRCNSIYYIETSVLLENILLVKFIKTTSGTRVVYFP